MLEANQSIIIVAVVATAVAVAAKVQLYLDTELDVEESGLFVNENQNVEVIAKVAARVLSYQNTDDSDLMLEAKQSIIVVAVAATAVVVAVAARVPLYLDKDLDIEVKGLFIQANQSVQVTAKAAAQVLSYQDLDNSVLILEVKPSIIVVAVVAVAATVAAKVPLHLEKDKQDLLLQLNVTDASPILHQLASIVGALNG